MGKSIIPFFIENPYLRNIFIDASNKNDLSSIFNFHLFDQNTPSKKKNKNNNYRYLFFKKVSKTEYQLQ